MLKSRIVDSLATIPAAAWNALAGGDNPFIRHEFLSALERHHCLHEYGWHPQHVLVEEDGVLLGAMPLYIKDNSYGELIMDWNWAEAYHRAGLRYFPKLVSTTPYSPVTSQRLIIADASRYQAIAGELIDAALRHAEKLQASSLHWLFTNQRDTQLLQEMSFAIRLTNQFHWQNQHYTSFDHFLETFSADKRKKIKRERRRVMEQGITLEIRHGDEMNDELWEIYHQFYCSTFERKSGMPTLSLEFFSEIGRTLPRAVVVVLARHNNEYVASAFNMRSTTTLYGRHWGCKAEYHSLHFEACFYQGQDYCIANQMQTFEPGAGGEHKLSRGFLPTDIWSAHWIAHPEFRSVIYDYCRREQGAMREYMAVSMEHSPYRQS